jgi:hypothetical protein
MQKAQEIGGVRRGRIDGRGTRDEGWDEGGKEEGKRRERERRKREGERGTEQDSSSARSISKPTPRSRRSRGRERPWK